MDQICFNRTHFLIFIVICLAIVIFGITKVTDFNNISKPSTFLIKIPETKQSDHHRVIEHIKFPGEITDPYTPPVRRSDYGITLPTISTQPCMSYQKVGIVYDPDNPEHRLPLYGRKKYYNGNKYEYYIQDSSRHANKLVVKSQNDNELFTNDTVQVPGYSNELTVSIYDMDEPKYCPYLI